MPDLPRSRRRVLLPSAVLTLTVASALTAGLLAPPAAADSLTDRRAQVSQQIAKTRSDLAESSQALSAAGVEVDRAQSRLEQAQSDLAQTRADLSAAHERDQAVAAKLRRAKLDLAAAVAAVAKAQRALDAQVAMAGNMVRDQYQQQTNLLPLAVLMEMRSTSDLQTKLQWSTTMFDTTSTTIDRLTVLRARLAAAKAKQAALTAGIAKDRKAAADNLELRLRLEARAAAQERTVASLVQQRRAVEQAAASDVAQDKNQYARLTRERASVERRIAVRVARAKAAAARQAAQARARQAAQERAAAQAAARATAQARRAKQAANRPVVRRPASRPNRPSPTRPAPRPVRPVAGDSGGQGFGYPVSAPVTSAYGMRLHPILGYWKLHDGTDFGAGCGSVIRAPYSGRVAERYYNSAYGNRLMIDHGMIRGRFVTTGYNHAARYTVAVGQRVTKGQVIGYVGTTGLSTGCHLHLMVWQNGSLSNPMAWF